MVDSQKAARGGYRVKIEAIMYAYLGARGFKLGDAKIDGINLLERMMQEQA